MSLTKRDSIIYAWRPVLIMNGTSEMNEWNEWIEWKMKFGKVVFHNNVSRKTKHVRQQAGI